MQVRIYAKAKGPNGEELFRLFYEGWMLEDPKCLFIDCRQILEMRENMVSFAIYDMDVPMGRLAYFSEPKMVELGQNEFPLKKFIPQEQT